MKNDIKIDNNVLDKRQLRESVPNLKSKAFAVRKEKKIVKEKHRETVSFMYNFAQETNATKQLWWLFISALPLNFFTQFSPEDPFENEL